MKNNLKDKLTRINDNYRILANNCKMNNNTRVTGLNNNDLVIGPSGAGKTRSYVKPNIIQCNESMVVADTKGSLIYEVGPVLEKAGYEIINMDFKNLSNSYGYNPLDFIHYDSKRNKYSEQDIMRLSSVLVPDISTKDPFWDLASRMYLTSLIAYVMECLPEEEHTLEYVAMLAGEFATGNYRKLLHELEEINPDSFAVSQYKMIRQNNRAERTEASIICILAEKLNGLNFESARKMYSDKNRIDFKSLGRKKTALFLTISDTDRSMDRLVSLLYTQAIHELCYSADTEYKDHRLPVPVRFMLDDFATNAYIPDFENIISVIRSREIYVSIILQSISQLTSLYGDSKAKTIINNCDNCLYLGGQDIETADFISKKANKPISTILFMPLNNVWLFTRGSEPKQVEKFDIRNHGKYCELPESKEYSEKGSDSYGY